MTRHETRKTRSDRRARMEMECLEARNLQSAMNVAGLSATSILAKKTAPAIHLVPAVKSGPTSQTKVWGGGEVVAFFKLDGVKGES